MMLRYHVQTDGFTLTEQQPLNNIIRVTLQALAAILGGCQSLHTNSFDEAWTLPTEQAVQLALRTQQIIAEESGVADVVDPLGGSFFLENLTDTIEDKATQFIKKIDDMGGALEAIRKGYIQAEIARSAYDYQRAVDSGEQVVVSVNKYIVETEQPPSVLEVNAEIENKQIQRITTLKRERDSSQVVRTLEQVKTVAKTNDNIMPALIDAARAYATVGEISDALREVFGEYREPNIL
jgi:methylmalonyl-CoA mutase N-terminal domain/subunit